MSNVSVTLDSETQRFFKLGTNINGHSQKIKIDKLWIEKTPTTGEHTMRIECSITLKDVIKKPGEPG